MCVDGVADGVDSMTAHWGGKRNYAFPSVKLVGQVVELVLEQQVTTVVIAPKWEAQWWWPLLSCGAALVVDLQPLLLEGTMFQQVLSNGRFHPLGKGAKAPESTQWVAAYLKHA
jgi:hypothetical protein